jgi:hypothetical protein
VLISGILDQLFQQNREDLLSFLARHGEAKVLLLHPVRIASSLEGSWVGHREEWIRYWLTNCNEAQVALDAIIEAGLDRASGFQLKFMTEIPPYFGVLVGDPAAPAARHPKAVVNVGAMGNRRRRCRPARTTPERSAGLTLLPRWATVSTVGPVAVRQGPVDAVTARRPRRCRDPLRDQGPPTPASTAGG